MASKFVVYLDNKKKFRFRLLASNGEIIAVGEGYESKASCLKGIKSIQKNAPVSPIEDTTLPKKEPTEEGKSAAKEKPTKKKPAKEKLAKKPVEENPVDIIPDAQNI